MGITFNSEVRFRHIIYPDARNWTTEALEKIKYSLLLTRRSDSCASHIETLEIEQRKLSRYSNGHNFWLEGPILEHKISRRSKLHNGSSWAFQMVLTFHSEVRFERIMYRDARNWTMEALEQFKWSKLLTRRSDSGASHIETIDIDQRKLSRYSNGHNF